MRRDWDDAYGDAYIAHHNKRFCLGVLRWLVVLFGIVLLVGALT